MKKAKLLMGICCLFLYTAIVYTNCRRKPDSKIKQYQHLMEEIKEEKVVAKDTLDM
ncbi:MAG: hypothetical protein AB8F74_04675 [Saprospiraceae bacterium]